MTKKYFRTSGKPYPSGLWVCFLGTLIATLSACIDSPNNRERQAYDTGSGAEAFQQGASNQIFNKLVPQILNQFSGKGSAASPGDAAKSEEKPNLTALESCRQQQSKDGVGLRNQGSFQLAIQRSAQDTTPLAQRRLDYCETDSKNTVYITSEGKTGIPYPDRETWFKRVADNSYQVHFTLLDNLTGPNLRTYLTEAETAEAGKHGIALDDPNTSYPVAWIFTGTQSGEGESQKYEGPVDLKIMPKLEEADLVRLTTLYVSGSGQYQVFKSYELATADTPSEQPPAAALLPPATPAAALTTTADKHSTGELTSPSLPASPPSPAADRTPANALADKNKKAPPSDGAANPAVVTLSQPREQGGIVPAPAFQNRGPIQSSRSRESQPAAKPKAHRESSDANDATKEDLILGRMRPQKTAYDVLNFSKEQATAICKGLGTFGGSLTLTGTAEVSGQWMQAAALKLGGMGQIEINSEIMFCYLPKNKKFIGFVHSQHHPEGIYLPFDSDGSTIQRQADDTFQVEVILRQKLTREQFFNKKSEPAVQEAGIIPTQHESILTGLITQCLSQDSYNNQVVISGKISIDGISNKIALTAATLETSFPEEKISDQCSIPMTANQPLPTFIGAKTIRGRGEVWIKKGLSFQEALTSLAQ